MVWCGVTWCDVVCHGGVARSERYRHETHEQNVDSDDDADDSMFHSFSSCSPRYSHDHSRLDRVRLLSRTIPLHSLSVLFVCLCDTCQRCPNGWSYRLRCGTCPSFRSVVHRRQLSKVVYARPRLQHLTVTVAYEDENSTDCRCQQS